MYADDTSLMYPSGYIEVINDSVSEDLHNPKS